MTDNHFEATDNHLEAKISRRIIAPPQILPSEEEFWPAEPNVRLKTHYRRFFLSRKDFGELVPLRRRAERGAAQKNHFSEKSFRDKKPFYKVVFLGEAHLARQAKILPRRAKFGVERL